MGKKKKVRVKFRKNRNKQARRPDLTREVLVEGSNVEDLPGEERVSGRSEIARYRTIITDADDVNVEDGDHVLRAVDESECLHGRVLSARGADCLVEADDGRRFECAVRRVLRTLAREARTAVVAGDRVLFRPVVGTQGVVERVNPRHGMLSRMVRGRRHILVANVDQVLIVGSAADPALKTNLIDRYLISAELGELRPIICINKVDLVAPEELAPIADVYRGLGYTVLLASASTGTGIEELRHLLQGRETVVSGQSGVGKSSLLNAMQPGLRLRTATVSIDSRKGRHTTTSANLIKLEFGGWVVDTPGIRQMELADVASDDIAGYFPDFRPHLPHCRFPNCTHSHESDCAVKLAVEQDEIAPWRYESYLRLISGEPMPTDEE
ncbi:MAG TPA: ribosome small subunit-dependent GTPase A [Planctomycetaceae bacterium]|nr:ribosome small subunit-dependent GTPase A [Planctomycetaceae bacterium]